MGVVKAKALGNKYPQLSERRRKSEKTRTPKKMQQKRSIYTFRDIVHHNYGTRPILHTGMKPISSQHSKIFTADDERLNERE